MPTSKQICHGNYTSKACGCRFLPISNSKGAISSFKNIMDVLSSVISIPLLNHALKKDGIHNGITFSSYNHTTGSQRAMYILV